MKIILGKVDRVKRVINSYIVDIEMTTAEVTFKRIWVEYIATKTVRKD